MRNKAKEMYRNKAILSGVAITVVLLSLMILKVVFVPILVGVLGGIIIYNLIKPSTSSSGSDATTATDDNVKW